MLKVGAGQTIGKVAAPGWCKDGHVHLSVLKLGDDGGYIDPSRHMERREMPPPKWRQECDHYILVWKVLPFRVKKLKISVNLTNVTTNPKTIRGDRIKTLILFQRS